MREQSQMWSKFLLVWGGGLSVVHHFKPIGNLEEFRVRIRRADICQREYFLPKFGRSEFRAEIDSKAGREPEFARPVVRPVIPNHALIVGHRVTNSLCVD